MDSDGILDGFDRCPNTPSNTTVDRFGCTANYLMGVHQLSTASAEFYVNSQDWVDLHYNINGSAQQSIRMTLVTPGNTFITTGLKAGDIISYNFTYFDRICNCQTESQTKVLIMSNPTI